MEIEQPLLSDSKQSRATESWLMISIEQEEVETEHQDEEIRRRRRVNSGTSDDEDTSSSSPSVEPTDRQGSGECWYYDPLQITAMISNFSTSYNVVNISLVLPIVEQLIVESGGTTSEEDKAAVASSLLAGMVVGQLVGGALGDSKTLGRLGALRLVMCLQIVASVGSAFCALDDIYLQLAVWRFFLGVGAGGVYPLAAVLSAEQGGANRSTQDESLHRVVLTFSMQGVGFLSVPLIAVTLLYTVPQFDVVWRVIVGLGSLPGFVLMLLQWRRYAVDHRGGRRHAIPTTSSDDDMDVRPRQELVTTPDDGGDSDGDIGTILDSTEPEIEGSLQSDDSSLSDEPPSRQSFWDAVRHENNLIRKLLGTAGTWFLFDVLFYGNTLFQPIVIEAAFRSRDTENALRLLQQTAFDSLLLTSIALPGYGVAGLLLGSKACGISQTPRFVMLQGFAVMSVLYLVIGVLWTNLRQSPVVLIILYGLTFFFANYGPNTTTFVLPSLVFSTDCRSTLNGVSAAAGKAGALAGATLFAPAADSFGDSFVMMLCSGIAIVAFMMTHFFVVTQPSGGRDD